MLRETTQEAPVEAATNVSVEDTAPLTVVMVPLEELQEDPQNPNTHDFRNLDAIEASLREHGQVEPLVVQKSTGMVVGGNGRLAVMRRMGWTHAACALLDINDRAARRLSIRLNRTSELSLWDPKVLAQHLQELSADGDFDPSELGFSDEEYMKLVSDLDGLTEGLAGLDAAQKNEELATNGGAPVVPAGTQPEGMPASHVRMVQLFFNERTEQQFRHAAALLAKHHGTDNITDTVLAVFLAAKDEIDEE